MKQLSIALLAAFALAGCAGTTEPADLAVASYPAQFVAEALAGDDLSVAVLGNGADLHNFEPSIRDLSALRDASHLVLWDEGLEAWAHQAEESLGGSAPATFHLFALPGIEEPIGYEGEGAHDEHADHGENETHMEAEPHDEHDDHDEHGEEDFHEGHNHGDYDPHSWNDPLAMKESALLLSAYLQDAYPAFQEGIQERTDTLVNRLDGLHETFQNKLNNCQRDVIVTNHEAYNYIAKRYNFEVIALHGLSPGSEPTSSAVQEAIEAIEEHSIPVMYIEEGTDPGALKAIQEETGVLVHVLHTNEVKPRTGDYISSQHQNTEKLEFALDCT